MRLSHPSGIIGRMDTPQAPAASLAASPAEAPADADAGARLQAHLKAMADAEQSVAATDDVVAQAVHGATPPQD